MRRLNLVALLSAMFVFFSCNSQKKAYKDLGDGLFADIEIIQGNIIVKLNYKETPITVANFVTLAEGKNRARPSGVGAAANNFISSPIHWKN